MKNLIEWLKGKKTYIVALVVGVLGFAQAVGYVVPDQVYVILSALGLGALRDGINTATESVVTPVKKVGRPKKVTKGA